MSYLLVNLFESFLGDYRKFNENTGQISFDCPACSSDKGLSGGDGKGNLEINFERGVFKCWSCMQTNEMHGSVLKLLYKYANDRIIRDYLLIKPEHEFNNKPKQSNEIITLPDGFKLLKNCSSKDFLYETAINYLNKRGITSDIIDEYNIGYTTIGNYANRIIIPSYDIDNNLNYFTARWFLNKKNKLKYLNPSKEKTEIIFNEKKIEYNSTIYLVEGPTDHIIIPNSIPLLGKEIAPKIIDRLYDNAKAFIVIVLDGDALYDAIEIYKKLNFGDLYDRIKICFTPTNFDPSLIHEKLGKQGIIKLLKTARKPTQFELDYL